MATHTFPKNTRLIDVGHSRLAHRKVGTGPDLVFVHGWPLHSATWRNVVPFFADKFTCHLFDMPGTGQSEWDQDSPISVGENARSLRKAIDALGIDDYALLGHDSGGGIARFVAAEDDRVRGLVIGNTEIPGHHPAMVKAFIAISKLPGGKASLPLALRLRAVRRSFLGYGGCFHDLDLIDGEFFDLFVAPLLSSSRATAGQMRLLENFSWDEIDSLAGAHAHIKAPTQLLWGVDDPFFPMPKARRMQSQFAGSTEMHVIDPGKLFVHEEYPEIWAGHALPFLQRCFDQQERAGAPRRSTPKASGADRVN